MNIKGDFIQKLFVYGTLATSVASLGIGITSRAVATETKSEVQVLSESITPDKVKKWNESSAVVNDLINSGIEKGNEDDPVFKESPAYELTGAEI